MQIRDNLGELLDLLVLTLDLLGEQRVQIQQFSQIIDGLAGVVQII